MATTISIRQKAGIKVGMGLLERSSSKHCLLLWPIAMHCTNDAAKKVEIIFWSVIYLLWKSPKVGYVVPILCSVRLCVGVSLPQGKSGGLILSSFSIWICISESNFFTLAKAKMICTPIFCFSSTEHQLWMNWRFFWQQKSNLSCSLLVHLYYRDKFL